MLVDFRCLWCCRGRLAFSSWKSSLGSPASNICHTETLAGLEAGDEVVTGPFNWITPSGSTTSHARMQNQVNVRLVEPALGKAAQQPIQALVDPADVEMVRVALGAIWSNKLRSLLTILL